MRNKITIFSTLVLLSVMLLSGCGPMYETRYHYTPPTSEKGRHCLIRCQQNQNTCKNDCRLRQSQCELNERDKARFKYESYKQDQKDKGLEVAKTLRDFMNSWGSSSCSFSCGCLSTYNSCYELCGGKVEAEEVCTAFCEEDKPQPTQ
jgi:hypothetical protein